MSSVRYYPNTKIYDLGLKYGIKIDSIKRVYAEPYHKASFSETPLISNAEFRWIFCKFLKEVILSKERLLNAIEIQKKFMSKEEILDMYSVFCGERIKDLEKDLLLFYAK